MWKNKRLKLEIRKKSNKSLKILKIKLKGKMI